jgi:hypothetical protein
MWRGHRGTHNGDSVELLIELRTLDEVLKAHRAELGGDLIGYRNHAYRVVNLCAALAPLAGDGLEKVVVAAAFHDLGIWAARTFDYLAPSARLAQKHLAAVGRTDWISEVDTMILAHHKLTPPRAPAPALAEAFRKADWIDVSCGLLRFGLPRPRVRIILSTWPSAGFHRRLFQLTLGRLRTNPFNPLPMIRR